MTSLEAAVFQREVAGVRAPDSRLARDAVELAREVSSPLVFNHVMRSYYLGRILHPDKHIDDELVFLSAVLHDLGLTPHATGPRRFEIEGADAAKRFMEEHGAPADRSWFVWDTIALHPWDMNLYKEPEAQAVQAGILADVVGVGVDTIDRSVLDELLAAFPRADFKNGFFELLLKEAKAKPNALTFHPSMMILEHCCGGLPIPDAKAIIDAAPFAE